MRNTLMRALALAAALLILPSARAASQQIEDPNILLLEARTAIIAENYQRAVELLQEGKRRFPTEIRFVTELGELFSDKRLYQLAVQEYLAAAELAPADYSVLNKLANTWGYLNEEHKAIAVFERLHELFPDDAGVVGDLGWMYFKTHQLAKGEAILLAGLERHRGDHILSMTLATTYSAMYNYEKSRKYYLDAIRQSQREGNSYFASIAWYNLSLLERAFYNHALALEATNQSLKAQDRSSGHLARGEIWQAAVNFRQADADYQRGYQQDQETPFATLNMAQLALRSGRLKAALALVDEVANQKDLSWMYFYGTDRTRFSMDLHEMYRDIHEGLANIEGLKARDGLLDWLGGLATGLYHRAQAWYHGTRFRSFAQQAAESMYREQNLLEGYWTWFHAHQDYPALARTWLLRARDIELAVAPKAQPLYQYHLGVLDGDAALVRAGAEGFDQEWERESIVDALVSLAGMQDGAEARRSAAQAFAINPGSLRQKGLRAPLRVQLEGFGDRSAHFAGLLAQAGLELAEGADLPLLIVKTEQDRLVWRMDGRAPSLAPIACKVDDNASMTAAANALADQVCTAPY